MIVSINILHEYAMKGMLHKEIADAQRKFQQLQIFLVAAIFKLPMTAETEVP